MSLIRQRFVPLSTQRLTAQRKTGADPAIDTRFSIAQAVSRLAATCLIGAAVTVTIDAIAAALLGLADCCADETTGNRADCSATPAVGDDATDKSATACADRGAALSGCAGGEGADEGTSKHELFHNGFPSLG